MYIQLYIYIIDQDNLVNVFYTYKVFLHGDAIIKTCPDKIWKTLLLIRKQCTVADFKTTQKCKQNYLIVGVFFVEKR